MKSPLATPSFRRSGGGGFVDLPIDDGLSLSTLPGKEWILTDFVHNRGFDIDDGADGADHFGDFGSRDIGT